MTSGIHGGTGSESGKARWLLLSLFVLVLDQWTKWLIELHLPAHASHPVLPGLFNLTHVRNTGVAFGLFASGGEGTATLLLAGLGLIALLVVGYYFWKTPPAHHLLLGALALVLGGAVGNLLDRCVAGAVTDFIDVYWRTHHWPAFNVADSAITIGLLLLAADTLRPAPRSASHPSPVAAP
jgi:signal peptidase II